MNGELVWDDSVAPETCIDFDAPQVSGQKALLSLGLMFGFLLTVFGLVKLSDPEGRNPALTMAEYANKDWNLYVQGLGEMPEDVDDEE